MVDWTTSSWNQASGVCEGQAKKDGTAELTTAVDLSGNTSVNMTFDWTFTSNNDAGEYFEAHISDDGGTTYHRILSETTTGSGSVEVNLTDFISLTNNFKIFFNHSTDDNGETATVDNINLTDYFLIDTDEPSNISFVPPTPANESTVTVDYIYVNVSVGDDVGVSSALLEWNGQNESMTKEGSGTNVTFNVNKTSLLNGDYDFRVWANDTSNNFNVSEMRRVTVSIPNRTTSGQTNVQMDIIVLDTDGTSKIDQTLDTTSWSMEVPKNGFLKFFANESQSVNAEFRITASGSGIFVNLSKLASNPEGSSPPFPAVDYWNLSNNVTNYDQVEISINYTDNTNESSYKIYHFTGGDWVQQSTAINAANDLATATVSSLSSFSLVDETVEFLTAFEASGRFNLSRPAESDVNTTVGGCSQGTAQSAKCHQKTETKSNTVPNEMRMGGSGANGGIVLHPGVNRAPAAVYPGWIHQMHGGDDSGNHNWPQWIFRSTGAADGGTGGQGDPALGSNFTNISQPLFANLSAGWADSTIGSGSSIQPFRNKQYQEREDEIGTNDYESEGIAGDEATTGADNSWGNPAAGNGAWFVGCGYGTASDDGCHGINANASYSLTDSATFTRDDSIACLWCHNGSSGTGITIQTTNSKHNVATGALCSDCHYDGVASTATPSLGSNISIIPEVKECFDSNCHNSTNTKFSADIVNTTGAHAGGECKYCHGHPHNATRISTWNQTCGNTDGICHSTDAPSTRNIGGDATFRHGGPTTNITCGDCHIPTGSVQETLQQEHPHYITKQMTQEAIPPRTGTEPTAYTTTEAEEK
jgi:hypothetical protein